MNIYSKRYNTDIDDSKIDNQKNLILELIFKILSDEDKIDFLIKYPHLIFKLIFQSEYKILSIFLNINKDDIEKIKDLINYINNTGNNTEDDIILKIKTIEYKSILS
jgi:hypothetical protein